MADRKNYEDKLDKILDETSAKLKEKPQIEQIATKKSNNKKILFLVFGLFVVLIGGFIAFSTMKKGNVDKKPTTKNTEMVELKDLSGLTVDQAENVLREDKISIVVDNYIESEEYEKDQIVSQTPKDSRVKKGTKVHVVLSKGPHLIVVPKLTGMKEKKAVKQLEKLGILVDVRYEHNSDVKKGRITDTSVAAGTKVSKGSEIQLIVSKGEDKSKIQQTVIPDTDEQINNSGIIESSDINSTKNSVNYERETVKEKTTRKKEKKSKKQKENNPQIIEVID